ncbi:hypothetical protein HU720_01470 [Pseudomonas sp. SWRI51]|uniref:hypothetical protein n=1 Tax=Pseudomonas sp. SWRI51 TaxID=2745491 RepID=UPI001644EDFD|nr:hypothetical protein [Pseudomonas sp. SWRI51]MBC3409971.1 hypothetical protein [Pseudomonas sp. SWRI51]
MAGISGISISNPAATQPLTTAAADDSSEGKQTSLQIDGTALALGSSVTEAQKKAAASEPQSDEPAHIKQLREMIKELQKQMAEEQKQLAALMAQKVDDSIKLPQVMAKQASIATLSGQIQAATAQLLEALVKLGSASSGSMVDTQA